MNTLPIHPERAGAGAAFVNALLATAALIVAFGFIGVAALSDPAQLAQMAQLNPAPLLAQDVLKIAQALVAGVLVSALFRRLREQAPLMARAATVFGVLAVIGLLLNAGLSLYAVTWASDAALSGLITASAVAVIVTNGLWYLLVSWAGLRTERLPRRLGQFGLVLGGLSLLPPLGVIVLLLSIVWSLWLSWALLQGDSKTARAATPGQARSARSWMNWHLLRWTPLAALLLVVIGLLIMLALGGLTKISAWYALQLLLPALGLINLVIVGGYSLIRRRMSGAVLITALASFLALLPAIQMVMPVMAYPAAISATTPAATVRLPADGPLKILWGGDNLAENVHAALPDQRWAYDISVQPYLTGSAVLTDYGCYGIPVVAPANGVVVMAHDGEPDMTPGIASNNFQTPEGNVIALKLEATGTYLVIAHLKPGSLRVKIGDKVIEGQPLARCGNSGNTSEPHIHIHHQRQDPTLYPINWAEGLPLFFRDHSGRPMPTGGFRVENGQSVATGDTVQHMGK